MNETLEDFIHGYGFPLATEIGKLGLLYLTTEPGNADLFDKYLFTSFALDGAETFIRVGFKPDSKIRLSCTERHLVYDIPRFLINIIQNAALDLSMTISDWTDRRRGR